MGWGPLLLFQYECDSDRYLVALNVAIVKHQRLRFSCVCVLKTLRFIRVGFWQNGFSVVFIFGPPDFFRGFSYYEARVHVPVAGRM